MKTVAGWTVNCFNGYNPQSQMVDKVVVAVYAENEEEALKKARQYTIRSDYRIEAVIESIDPYDLQESNIKGVRKQPYEK